MLLIYTVFLPFFYKLYSYLYLFQMLFIGGEVLDIYPEGLNVGTEMVSHLAPEVNR